ncbi:tyrosine-type recombinase/integrase [Lactococcus petauri]|uniref:tyrosine-type recombinase/integrase n=1 Tax=Lactococcus petauri TaxID=1940789 RepID=UPI0020BFFBD8|nr:tyrosine-type recombinase/integrase [Lactococcus petauri]UQU61201.1 Tyrosine recombinase XerC [Lactococcus petauri]WJE12801.1 tyrosine-type recombinase/integrase [Lactococcus petauri]
MASIKKRGKSYRVTVSNYKHGNQHKLTKSFKSKDEAKRWALQAEISKGTSSNLSHRQDTFTNFFENWVYIVKKNDVRPATFNNYVRTISIIKSLFEDIKISELNDLIVQSKIDKYGKTHSRKTTTEVLLKIRTSIRYAYARGLLDNDFSQLIKTRGKNIEKRNRALSITHLKLLRNYLLNNSDDEFNTLVLLALETGARRGELLGLKPEDIFKYGISVKRSISPTSEDTSLKNKKSRRDISINEQVYQAIIDIVPKSNGYLFSTGGFHQSYKLKKLLKSLNLPLTTFHGLRDTHASFLFSHDNIRLDYISQRLGHSSMLTTQNYYLELMPEKKHIQDSEALALLNSL